ncbi:MAG TPA: hypothetical protein VIF09_29245 [Polyangiaceae bacterium]
MKYTLCAAAALVACAGSAGSRDDHAAPAPPAAPSARAGLVSFEGAADLTHRILTLTYRSASGEVIKTTSTPLPSGSGPDQITLHTVPGTVAWEGACGTTTLCGQVEAINHYTGTVTSLVAVLDNVAPSSVTAPGAPWAYGDLSAGATSAPVTWAFLDPTGTDFTFKGHVEGNAPIADAGTDAGSSLDGPPCATASAAPATLAETGLYSDFATKTIDAARGVHAFDSGIHLWSDGLSKNRHIWLPPGTQIVTAGGSTSSGGVMDDWTFPVGTRAWKEFVMQGTRIETRFFEKCQDGSWLRTTYRWSADGQTSATELTTGALIPNTEPSANGAMYEIPKQAQCVSCHAGRIDNLLGFEALALSWTGDSWAAQATVDGMPAMARLATLGWLTQNPGPLPIPGRNQNEIDSFAWLHINCGVTCHNTNPNALANFTPLRMKLLVGSMATYDVTSTWTTAVNVPSHFSPTFPDGGVAFGWNYITPGSPETSTLPYRDSTRDPLPLPSTQQQMPPIVSHAVDVAATNVVKNWISGLP